MADSEVSELVVLALRRFRTERGLSQNDVAEAARAIGLDWNAPTVASLETGRRLVSLGELIMLPRLFFELDDSRSYSLKDIFELGASEVEEVRIGHGRYKIADLVDFIEGNVHPRDDDSTLVPEPGETFKMMLDREDRERLEPLRQWWPKALVGQLILAERDSAGEAERKAAAKLGIPAGRVSVLAHRKWDRGLTAERDARVRDELGGLDADARALQALRGHVTRKLLEELRDAVTAADNRGR